MSGRSGAPARFARGDGPPADIGSSLGACATPWAIASRAHANRHVAATSPALLTEQERAVCDDRFAERAPLAEEVGPRPVQPGMKPSRDRRTPTTPGAPTRGAKGRIRACARCSETLAPQYRHARHLHAVVEHGGRCVGVQLIWPARAERLADTGDCAARWRCMRWCWAIRLRSMDIDLGVFDPGPTILRSRSNPRPSCPGGRARARSAGSAAGADTRSRPCPARRRRRP